MSEADQLKAEIERTRADLAHTVDALHHKLDVKAAAKHRAEEAGAHAAQAYANAKAATPPPVQQTIARMERAAQPVLDKAAENRKRTALVAGSALLLLLVVRRARRR